MDISTLIVDAHCGRLSYLCCLGSVSKLRDARDALTGLSDTDLDVVWSLVCLCAPAIGAGAKPLGPTATPGTETCIDAAAKWICTPGFQAALKTAKTLLDASGNGEEESGVVSLLRIFIDAAIAACISADRDFRNAMDAACKAFDAFQNWNKTGIPSSAVAAALVSLLFPLGVAPPVLLMWAALRACCPADKVATWPVPPGSDIPKKKNGNGDTIPVGNPPTTKIGSAVPNESQASRYAQVPAEDSTPQFVEGELRGRDLNIIGQGVSAEVMVGTGSQSNMYSAQPRFASQKMVETVKAG